MSARGGRRSGAGRPRRPGVREANGRLQRGRDTGAARVVQLRAYLCPDPRLATTPFDVIYGRGWIDQGAYQAGLAFAALCRRSGLMDRRLTAEGGTPLSRQEMREAEDRDRRSFSNLQDREVAALWDMAFSLEAGPDPEERTQKAAQALARFSAPLSLMQRRRLFSLCALGEWPPWLFRLVEEERRGQPVKLAASAKACGRGEGERSSLARQASDPAQGELAAVRSALECLLRRS